MQEHVSWGYVVQGPGKAEHGSNPAVTHTVEERKRG